MAMDHYLVLKTSIDNCENAKNSAKLFYNIIDAKLEFYGMIDDLKSRLAFFYSMPFEEFDIADFGDIIEKDDVFVYKDFAGIHNIKIELIRL